MFVTEDLRGADYRRSRAAFRQAASALGAELTEYRNEEASGPRGEALVTDVAVLGQAGAPKRLVIVSGTHGIEGIGGSAAQVALMASGLLSSARPKWRSCWSTRSTRSGSRTYAASTSATSTSTATSSTTSARSRTTPPTTISTSC